MSSAVRRDTPCWCDTGPNGEPLPWFRLWFQQWHIWGEPLTELAALTVDEQGIGRLYRAEDVTFNQPKEWKDPNPPAGYETACKNCGVIQDQSTSPYCDAGPHKGDIHRWTPYLK